VLAHHLWSRVDFFVGQALIILVSKPVILSDNSKKIINLIFFEETILFLILVGHQPKRK